MTISLFSRGLTATRMVALAAVLGLGAVLAGLQSAQASLIDDNIIVTTFVGPCNPCVDGDGTATNGILVVDGGDPELGFTGDTSSFGTLFDGDVIPMTSGARAPIGTIDILESSIVFTFSFDVGPGGSSGSLGFQGSFVFSSLDWFDFSEGVILDVICITGCSDEDLGDNGDCMGTNCLSSDITINEVTDHSFRVAIDCFLPTGCVNGDETITLTITLSILTTGHDGNGPTVPEPGSLALFGIGLAGLGFMTRRRRNRRRQN